MLWGHGRAVAPETTSIEKESAFVSTPATTVLPRLLPDAPLLRLEACDVDDTTAQIALRVQSTQTRAPCPLCTTSTQRIHSHYERTLADLPWAAYRVRLQLPGFSANNPPAHARERGRKSFPAVRVRAGGGVRSAR